MTKDLTRISLMIREDQHKKLQKMDVNISGYIRDLIDDRFSDHTIILSVSRETKAIYDQIISQCGEGDREFEPFIRKVLKEMLHYKVEKLKALSEKIE